MRRDNGKENGIYVWSVISGMDTAKNSCFYDKMQIYLHMSEIFCTFAPNWRRSKKEAE